MTAEETLKEITETLDSDKKQTGFKSQRKPAVSEVDLAKALMQLHKLMKQQLQTVTGALDKLAREKRVQNDWLQTFSDFQFQVEKQSIKADAALSKIKELTERLDRRMSQVDMMEAKHMRMVLRVDDVLSELEEVLKRM